MNEPWFIRWWPWVPLRWLRESQAENARLREGLLTIGTSCTNFTWGRCSDPYSGRTRGARYGADAWCDGCIAHEALGGHHHERGDDDL